MTVPLHDDELLQIYRQVERLRRYSDRLVGIGPFGIGIDGLLAWIPIASPIYSAGAGGWLVVQAVRSGASAATIVRMLGYLGFDTATSAVPLVGSAVDFLFPGHLLAARALMKDIEMRHPHARPTPAKGFRLRRARQS